LGCCWVVGLGLEEEEGPPPPPSADEDEDEAGSGSGGGGMISASLSALKLRESEEDLDREPTTAGPPLPSLRSSGRPSIPPSDAAKVPPRVGPRTGDDIGAAAPPLPLPEYDEGLCIPPAALGPPPPNPLEPNDKSGLNALAIDPGPPPLIEPRSRREPTSIRRAVGEGGAPVMTPLTRRLAGLDEVPPKPPPPEPDPAEPARLSRSLPKPSSGPAPLPASDVAALWDPPPPGCCC